MELVVTLRKEIETEEQAETLFNLVKTRLEDYPDIKINGHTSKRLDVIPD